MMEDKVDVEIDHTNKYRQVNLVRLNESVNLLSGYKCDTIEKLLKQAMDIMEKLKE